MLTKLIDLKNKNRLYIILILFFVVLIMRSHTLFNDYYDRDFQTSMVATWHQLETGDQSLQSYGKPYTFLLYYPLKLFGKYNWRVLHFLAIILVFLTSIACYYAAKTLVNENAGFLAAFFYAFFINSYNKDFLAFSAEIVFNAYIAFSFMFLVLTEFKNNHILKRGLFFILMILFAILAAAVKLHAMFYLLVPALFYILIKPRTRQLKIISISLSGLILAAIILYDTLLANSHIIHSLLGKINFAIQYILAPRNLLDYALINMLVSVFSLLLSQFLLWWLFYRFFKNSQHHNLNRKKEFQLLMLISISSLIPVILTLRFYPHYFIQLVLPAAICAAIELEDWSKGSIKHFKYRKFITIWLLLPLSFYLLGFYSLLALKIMKPDYPNEMNMFLPNSRYKKTLDWLKANTNESDRIMVWGDAVEIYYFSRRPSSGVNLWLGTFASNYFRELEDKGKVARGKLLNLKNIIQKMEQYQTAYFIDSQPADYANFGQYEIKKIPLLYNYIMKNYVLAYNADNFMIYKRR